MTNERKTILVIGATGAQGGSVARHLLTRGQYAVRALTRNPQSPAARELRALGAEIVRGDLEDVAGLVAAMNGAHGVFGVTNYWEHFDREETQGRNLVHAVAAAGVKHFVFSTLTHIAKATGGALRSPHFDVKAEHEDLTRTLGIPATFVHVPWYYENFLGFFPPQPAGDGTYEICLGLGDTPMAAMAVEDLGLIVAAIFDRPDAYIGQVLELAAEELPLGAFAEALSRATGTTIRYRYVPRETFAALPIPGAHDIADMFEFHRRFMPSRRRQIEVCRTLAPELQSFDTWLTRNTDKLRATLQMTEAKAAVTTA